VVWDGGRKDGVILMTDITEFTGDCGFDACEAGFVRKGYGLQCSPVALREDFTIARSALIKGVLPNHHPDL